MLVSTLLWADLANIYVWVGAARDRSASALIGFYDDYLKVTKQIASRLFRQGAAGARVRSSPASPCCVMIAHRAGSRCSTSLAFPFFKDFVLNLGWFFIAFAAFVIVGAGNAVNLTDGLDGLAIVPVMIAAASFGLIAYLVRQRGLRRISADPFRARHRRARGACCGAVIGAGLGFLWFNAPPAAIFMGDTGSLALGGLLGTVAVATKHEIVLAIIGGLFVLEALSVIIQVASFKLTGKRVFRMAPIHHHFEQLGWTGAAGRDPLLDHRRDARADRPVDPEAAGEDGDDPGSHLRRQARRASSGSAAAVARRRARWSQAAPMCSPGTTSRTASPRRRAAGIADRRPRARPIGRGFAALVLVARRAAHPSRAALDRRHGARLPASRSSATSSCSAASGAPARRRAPFIAITGTNGKSTTTALIGAHLLGRPGATRRSAAISAARS